MRATTPPFAQTAPFLRQGKQDGAPARTTTKARVGLHCPRGWRVIHFPHGKEKTEAEEEGDSSEEGRGQEKSCAQEKGRDARKIRGEKQRREQEDGGAQKIGGGRKKGRA